MACNNCTSTAPLTTFDVQYFYSNQCFDCGTDECTGKINNAKCIVYTGPNLSCSGINTNDSLETALQKIDEQICSAIGDYSNYQFNCLTAWWGSAITEESEFVDAITGYACEIRTDLDTFTGITFVDYQIAVNLRFEAIEVPGVSSEPECDDAPVGLVIDANHTLQTVLQELIDFDCALNTYIREAYTNVTWDACLTVVSPPTSLGGALQLLADQICQVNASFVLPTINNIGSCLATPGATDSIVDTIDKIKTYICDLPTFDIDAITWDCVTPQADLQDTIQELVTQASNRIEEVITWGADFVVTPNGESACDGITVDLVTPINQDRFVAVSVGDASPGTLIDKVASSGGSIAVTNDADTTLNLEIADGDKGDITISGSGATFTIDNNVVTFAKMQDINTNKLLGRSTGGSGDTEEINIGTGLLLSGGTLSATAEEVESGTYTPTLTNTTNLTSSTASLCQYMRVGSVVTVSGRVIVDPTAAAATVLTITLPVSSLFGAIYECGGTAFAPGIAGQGAAIYAYVGGNAVRMEWVAVDTTSQAMFFSFTYLVTPP